MNYSHWYGILGQFSAVTDDHLEECRTNGMVGLDVEYNPSANTQIDLAEQLDIPYTLSLQLDPTQLKTDNQVQKAVDFVRKRNPVAIILRINVHWLSWQEYVNVQNHSGNYMRPLSGEKITTFFYRFIQSFQKASRTNEWNFNILVASPNWYIRSYAKRLAPTIRRAANGYIGEQPEFYNGSSYLELSWTDFKKAIGSFEPLRINIPPLTQPAGFEIGFLPISNYPLMKVGLLEKNMYMTPYIKEDLLLENNLPAEDKDILLDEPQEDAK